MKSKLGTAVAVCMVLDACSSRPREFTPTLGSAVTDRSQFEAAYSGCKQLYVAGKLDSTGRLASGGAGAAAGGAVGALGTAAATSAGLYGGMAVMSATVILMPVAIVGGAIGMAKIKRHKKEKAMQRVMEGCLHEHGYDVASWEKVSRTKSERKAAD